MKAVIQRVTRAEVEINREKVNGPIGQGLVVMLGVIQGDTEAQAEFLAKKIVGLRIFNDENGRQNRSLLDVGGELLVISNFTLGADCSHGKRPFYGNAAAPDSANSLYGHFVTCAGRELGKPIITGEFGAHMEVTMTGDGPITIVLDTKELGK